MSHFLPVMGPMNPFLVHPMMYSHSPMMVDQNMAMAQQLAAFQAQKGAQIQLNNMRIKQEQKTGTLFFSYVVQFEIMWRLANFTIVSGRLKLADVILMPFQ